MPFHLRIEKRIMRPGRMKRLCSKLLLFLFVITASWQTGYGQAPLSQLTAKIDYSTQQTTATKLFDVLQQQSGYSFLFDRSTFNSIALTNIRYKNSPLGGVLNSLQKTNGFLFSVAGKNIAVKQGSMPVKSPGKISGRIIDEENGEPVVGATIRIGDKGMVTDITGFFTLAMPAGNYTVTVSSVGYGAKEVTGVDVKDNETFPLNITLKRKKGQLAGVVVTASAKKESVNMLYVSQKKNAAVSDGITAEQISRTPDNNTAQVLKRISGLQVFDNKFVVIRGLSDRYNNVLLNGAMLPSSEPNKRNFAFDMVPSAILDRIVVNKTATPDLTGEFTGGLVQIETKGIPDENFLTITVGTGYNSQSTGKDMIGLDRGKNAWAGFASDIHKKPVGMSLGQYSALESGIDRSTPASDPKRQQIGQFLSTMPENWTMKKYTAMPVQNYQLQLGRAISFKNESRLGLIAALTYRNEQNIEKRDLLRTDAHDYKGTSNNYSTMLGGSLNLGYQFGKHKFTLQNTYNRKFSDNLWKYTGTDIEINRLMDSYSDVTLISQLFQSQLSGEHILSKSGIKADWLVSAGRIDRDQPYSRTVGRANGAPDAHLPPDYLEINLTDNQLKNGSLYYSELNEHIYNWAANVQVPFQWLNLTQTFKTGYHGKYRTAAFGANLYRMYKFNDGNYPAGTPYDQVFTQEHFATDLYLHSVSGMGGQYGGVNSEGYDGDQHLHAFYAMLDLKPLKRLRLVGGMRAEQNEQNVYDYRWDPATKTSGRMLTSIKQTDWLPSVNAIYSITDKLNFRAAWYKSVARPDFREISDFSYWDYDLFATVAGSPLQTTKIDNADLRLEYYPAPGEVLSLSGFYKHFRNPIEVMYMGRTNYFYKNLESALDKGLEVDFRKSLNFIQPSSSFWPNLYLSGNFTWLDASINFYPSDAVDSSGAHVSPKRNRPLAGQSPYILNGGLMYAGKSFGVNLSYNRYGKRVVFASSDRGEDEFEKPRDLLDAQVSYKFLKQKRAELKFNVSNLFNQEQVFYKNQFAAGNPLGFDPRLSSVERYPGMNVESLPPGAADPKGTSYNKDYDTVVRRFKFGLTYSLNFTYRF